MTEIGAGILQVAVEEEFVERLADVVMVVDVVARPADLVDDAAVVDQLPQEAVELAASARRGRKGPVGRDHQHVEEFAQRAFLDGQPAIGIGLSDGNARLQRELPADLVVMEPDRHRRSGSRLAERLGLAVGTDHGEVAVADDPG